MLALLVWTANISIAHDVTPSVTPEVTPDVCTKAVCVYRKTFFEGFRTFAGEGLTDQAVTSLRLILNRWDTTEAFQDTRWLAYIIATAYHETAHKMFPVREGLKGDDDSVVGFLERQRRAGFIRTVYWDPDPVTKQRYYGRGMVQLTFRRNYIQVGARLGGDLVLTLGDVPDTALQPEVSVEALMLGMVGGWFNESAKPHVGQGLEYYLPPDLQDDHVGYVNARRTVNKLTPFDPVENRLAAYAETLHGFIVPATQSDFRSDKIQERAGAKVASSAEIDRGVDKASGTDAAEVDATREWGPKSTQATTTAPVMEATPPVPLKPVDACVSVGTKSAGNLSGKKLRKARKKERRALRDCRREQAR